MKIAIQAIQTIWTKDSRGGQGATRRNAVPEAFPLPSPDRRQVAASPSYVFQQIRCIERDDLRPTAQPLASDALLDTLVIDQLSIHPPDDTGIVHLNYHPRRPTYLGYARDNSGDYHPGGDEALALRTGEWGRIRYNWRHGATVSDDEWWYDQWVVNVGCFPELRADAILERPPSKIHSRLAYLR